METYYIFIPIVALIVIGIIMIIDDFMSED